MRPCWIIILANNNYSVMYIIMAVISNNNIMEQKNSELTSACYCTLICILHNLDYNDNVFR